MLRGKKENPFGLVPWANRYNFKFSRTFGVTISVTSGVSEKNGQKIMTKVNSFPEKMLWNAEIKLPDYITVTLDRELFRSIFTNKL